MVAGTHARVKAPGADPPAGTVDTKERLLRAGERVFARDGIHGARIRDINEFAGQRNPSALHYHFGSRDGLVNAILYGHQAEIDAALETQFDELERRAADIEVRDIVAVVIPPMVAKLQTESGRDWARMMPQVMPMVSANLRRGLLHPGTPQTHRVIDLLRPAMRHLGEAVLRERLVDYSIILTSLLAERAEQQSSADEPMLDDAAFATHLVEVLTAVLSAPSSVSGGHGLPDG